MEPQAFITKYHKVILYSVTLGLVVYGIMAIFNPAVLVGGFNRFTHIKWQQFHINNQLEAVYITMLWRLIGGFNLAAGLILTLIVWKWLGPGKKWAWFTLLFGTLTAYLSPISLDLTVRSIELFELIEFILFGLFFMTMLIVRREYFTRPESLQLGDRVLQH